jgi:hypothetical protein
MENNRISFSQYQMWKGCQHRWKLNYVDKLTTKQPAVALIFGTAMHEVLQEYLNTMYSSTVSKADELDLNMMLQEKIYSGYRVMLQENNGVHFSTADELREYYADGVEILKWFKSHRPQFFMKKNWELVGVEVPIEIIPEESRPSVRLIGYLDLVMKNTATGRIIIYDFKTSTNGWNKWAKGDKIKTSQLVLYKIFYAKQFNVHPDDIDIQYLILKRKIDENAEYQAMKKRIQKFEPPHGKISQSFITKDIQDFVKTAFNEDGTYNLNTFFAPTAGVKERNCKFCEFKDKEHICPTDKRINEE